ncbi:MAG: hypothetical protein Q9219_003476 [cf. Caloplaca sp. 3 TL-2023]
MPSILISLTLFHLTYLLPTTTTAHPAYPLNPPSRLTLPLNPPNSTTTTSPSPDFQLSITYSPLRLPIPPSGLAACVSAATDAAIASGIDDTLPRTGYKVVEEGVGVELWPFDRQFTWGLMAYTVQRVEAVLWAHGLFGCSFQLAKTEEETGAVRVFGRGHLWGVI